MRAIFFYILIQEFKQIQVIEGCVTQRLHRNEFKEEFYNLMLSCAASMKLLRRLISSKTHGKLLDAV